MRGGRVAAHAARNPALRARQARQTSFLRSTDNLRAAVQRNLKELKGPDLRALMPKSSPSVPLEPGPRQRAAEAAFEMMKSIVENGAPKLNDAMKDWLSAPAPADHLGRVAEGLGMLRDADGNIIYIDSKDQPYVRVADGKIVYVKVYQARITPTGRNLDAKCSIQNPDGKQEVLLVEPLPVLTAPGADPF